MLGITNLEEFPKFSTKKWVEIFYYSNGTYSPNKDIRFKTPQLRNDLCDFNDASIVVTGKIIATNPGNDNAVYIGKLALKNLAPFFNCILKINGNLIEDVQDLAIVTPMYNLLYYSKSIRKTTGSFWNYYPDMPNSGYNDANNVRTKIFYPIKDSKNFNYKTKLVGNVGNNLPVVII